MTWQRRSGAGGSSAPCGIAGAVVVLASAFGSGCTDSETEAAPEPLPPPAAPTAAALSARNVSLSWEPVAWEGAEPLTVERRIPGAEPTGQPVAGAAERSLVLGLQPDQAVDFRLCRAKAGRAPGCSDWVGVTTPATALRTDVAITVPYAEEAGADDLFVLGLVDFDDQPGWGAVVVIDRAGQVVWELVDAERGYVNDAELLEPDGTLLYGQFAETRMLSLFFEPVVRFVAADHPLIALPDPLFDPVTVTTSQYYHHDIDAHGDDALLSVVFTAAHDETTGWDVVADGIALYDRETGVDSWFIDLFDYYDVSTDACEPCLEELTFGTGHDFTHANALWFDHDNSEVYLNIRNLNRIAVFDYPSGDLVREIGDGGVTFSHAHDPQVLPDGSILVFDNGLHRPGGEEYSRAVQFREGAGGELEILWEYREDPDFYSDVMGDADRLDNGNTLITDATNGRLVEVDGDGNKVWEARLTGAGMRIYKTQLVAGPTFQAWCGWASP